MKSIFLALVGILSLWLSACGKPPARPLLAEPAPLSSDPLEPLILGKELSPKDLRIILRVFNKKWGEALSENEIADWVDFLNQWLYQDAQSPKGLLQILKAKISEKSFSLWGTYLNELFEISPDLRNDLSKWVRDEEFLPFVKRLVDFLGPEFLTEVIQPILLNEKNFVTKTDQGSFDKDLLLNDVLKKLENEEGRSKTTLILQELGLSGVLPAASTVGRNSLKVFGEEGLRDVISSLSKNIPSFIQALKLAQLLNRPGDRIIRVLQEGLRANPDAISALTLKWDPLLLKALSQMIQKSLTEPEDGQKLSKDFWLKLGAQESHAPGEEFIRLYSIIYSGIQKIADPRRFEAQYDSGSYRLPLQLNALFLTRFLEEVARKQKNELIWDAPVAIKEFRISLKDESIKADLKALGLTSTLSRLEKTFQEEDSGKQEYGWVSSGEKISLKDAMDEAVVSAHQLKPFFDVTPLLVATFQQISQLELNGAFPNLLAQAQGALSQLNSDQWKSVKKILFEDLKLAELEPEDRMLILGLFQSDEEVASWVNEVLLNLESILKLDESTESGLSVFGFYHSLLRQLSSEQIIHLGNALSLISEMEWVSPGVAGWIQNGTGLGKLLRGLAGLTPTQEKIFGLRLNSFLEKQDDGRNSAELLVNWVNKVAKRLPAFFEVAFNPVSDTRLLSLSDRDWLVRFSKEGGIERFSKLAKPNETVIQEIRDLSKRGVIDRGLRFLGQIQNERIQEATRVFLDWDRSGELESALNVITVFEKGEGK